MTSDNFFYFKKSDKFQTAAVWDYKYFNFLFVIICIFCIKSISKQFLKKGIFERFWNFLKRPINKLQTHIACRPFIVISGNFLSDVLPLMAFSLWFRPLYSNSLFFANRHDGNRGPNLGSIRSSNKFIIIISVWRTHMIGQSPHLFVLSIV